MLTLPAEAEEYRRIVRAAVDAEIIGRPDRSLTAAGFDPDLFAVVRKLGVTAVPFPAGAGGSGGSFLAFIVAIAELARGSVSAAGYAGTAAQVARAILTHGSRAMIEQWVAPLISNQILASWAFTEPETGSDPRQIQTAAVRDGTDWLISGQKTFISFAPQAAVAVVFAKTDSGRLGAFVVDTASGGWQAGPVMPLLADGFMTASVTLDQVRVPAEAVLGDPEAGFTLLISSEAEGKLRGSATCVGIADRALEEATRYALTRQHRGTAIGRKFPTLQTLLGDMGARLLAARSLTQSVAARVDAGADVIGEAAAAKLIATEAAREVTSSAVQICGAYGLSRDLVVERLYREGKMFDVIQGVAEIQRIIVARELMNAAERPG
jgi:alkylation response protein AidB-like acyl-CoA dehydrogenase